MHNFASITLQAYATSSVVTIAVCLHVFSIETNHVAAATWPFVE